MPRLTKRCLMSLLLLCAALTLSACRVRTLPGADALPSAHPSEAPPGQPDGAEAPAEGDPAEADGSRTRENPEAERKMFDPAAPAEAVPGTDRLLHGEGEGEGTPLRSESADGRVSRIREQAEDTATQTLPAPEAEKMGVSEEAEAAESAYTYYSVLLDDRLGSVFECQRPNLYWETAEDHVTVYRSSPEHGLILSAGAYDVSARLLPENLRVDDGWVARKNPGVIVKVTDSAVLGSGALTDAAARAAGEALLRREGWQAVDAVRGRRLLLLSEALLTTPHLQLAARLMIARTAFPGMFDDVDPAEALRRLTEEAEGLPAPGVWYCVPD